MRVLSVLLPLVVVLAVGGERAPAQTLSTRVTTTDGIGLATDVYFPVGYGGGPWPVVLQRTPYGRGALHSECIVFSLLGYACVAQDERGTGDSQGSYSGYVHEGADGRATVTWIAERGWSNGVIGTFGASALGLTQYAMAPAAPEALVAQVPIVGTPDLFHHAVYQGGTLRYSLTYNWLFKQGAEDVFLELTRHRLWDEYWDGFAVTPRIEEIDVPALHIGGWYDIFAQGTLDAYTEIQHRGGPKAAGNQRLIMGPWTHSGIGRREAGELTYPENAFYLDELLDELVGWFDHWLKDKAAPPERRLPVRVYLMGAVGEARAPGNVWLDLPDWPPPARPVSMFLAAAGSLSAVPGAPGSDVLVADPGDPVPTLGGQNLFDELEVDGRAMGSGPYDQRPIEARGDVLTYTTEPLSRAVEVMGRVAVRLWVIPGTTDLDLAVRLADIYPDGRSMLVTDGIQRARMRCSDEVECMLEPGVATEIVVDLWSTAIVFNAGHCIRLDVSGSNFPRFEVNPNTGTPFSEPVAGVVARTQLLFGGERPSRLVLPLSVRSPRRALRGPD